MHLTASLRSLLNPRRAGLITAGLTAAAYLGVFGTAGRLVLPAIAGASTLIVVTATRTLHLARRVVWWTLAFGVGLVAIGVSLRSHLNVHGVVSDDRPLLPDLFSLSGYLVLLAGVGGGVQHHRIDRSGRIDALLDAAMAAGGMFLLLWLFVFEPSVGANDPSAGIVMTTLVYPPLAAAILAMVLEIGSHPTRRRTAAMRWTTTAAFGLLVADVSTALSEAGAIPISWAHDVLIYTFAAVAFVMAGLDPSLADTISNDAASSRRPASPRRLALAAGSISLQALALVAGPDRIMVERLTVIVACLGLTALATTRIVRTLAQQARVDRQLRYLATHDGLTGLANRYGLVHTLERWSADDQDFTVASLDIDSFKLVNDAFGHHVGDALLVAVGERIRAATLSDDLVARTTGDEFFILTSQVSTAHEATIWARLLQERIGGAVVIGDVEIPLSISIGLAVSSSGTTPSDLLGHTEVALRLAKDTDRSSIVSFHASMTERIDSRNALERDLRGITERDELEVHYQPIADLLTGKVAGFEALLRWNHPERGLVSPLDFIPIAEETGAIVDIGAWVLDTALENVSRWRNDHPAYRDLWISVNVSARQLRDPDFVSLLRRSLHRHRIDPTAVCLEITESTMISDEAAVFAVLSEIRATGVRLAIDDFGTGYSSLAYVQRYPFTSVKIDRSFVELLDSTTDNGQLVGAIIAMSDALGCTTIAEGVETLEQAERLLALGCRTAQGWYYSRPLPADSIPVALERLGVARKPSVIRNAG